MPDQWQSRLAQRCFLGVVGAVVLALPAQAGRLQSWRFNAGSNQLEIRTESPVQPQAQIIFDPTRLVIDLPGVVLGRPQINQPGTGAIRQVRVAQFDPQTTRIVVELAPGYTLDANQVKFRGLTAQNWLVQLPEPQQISATATPAGLPTPANSPAQAQATPSDPTEITAIQSTGTGFYVATNGGLPTVAKIERSRDRRRIEIDLTNIRFGSGFNNREVRFERIGLGRVRARLSQPQRNTNAVRLTLQVEPSSPDWQIGTNTSGGFLVVPNNIATTALPTQTPPAASNRPQPTSGTIPINPIPPASAQTPPNPTPSGRPIATIQRVDLGGRELLIQGDRTLFYTVGWEGNAYRIRFRDVSLGNVRPPRTGEGSPANVQIRPDGNNEISVLVTPAAGVRVIGVTRSTGDSLIVQLQRPGESASPLASQVSVPSPRATNPNDPLPTPRSGTVVVIDPGHGGRDPGAIGIGGIREKDIVMDISNQVSRILQQQGVQVIMTRTSDVEVDLAPRVAMAERARAAAFISIHSNAISMSRPDVNGVETYYAPGKSSRLAASIHNSILSSINMRDRGVRAARFYVIRNTSMPAALVETGFVTGAEDAANFQSPAWRTQMAQAIARGILQFLRFGG